MKKPKKPKSSGIRKQEDIIKDYKGSRQENADLQR